MEDNKKTILESAASPLYDLLNSACEYFNIESGELNKLNLKKLDYSYRVRTIKSESGEIIEKIMDRGFIGLLKSKVFGGDCDSGDSVVNCFIYGKRTVGFIIESGRLYANSNLKKSADFLCLVYNVIKSQKAEFGGFIDNLPTGEIKRSNSGGDLESCINNVKSVEDLASDVGLF